MAFNWDWAAVRPHQALPNGGYTIGNWGVPTGATRDVWTGTGGTNWYSYNNMNGAGNSVIVIQQQLNKALNYWRDQGHPTVPAANLTVDGVLGAKSDRAIRFYQGVYALQVDGIIGSATWGLLKGE